MTAPATGLKRPGNRPGPAVQERPVAKAPAKPQPTKQAAKAAKPASDGAGKKEKALSAKGLPCLCGCGQPTQTDAARFIPGHDAKLKGLLLRIERGEAKKSEVPQIAKPFLQQSEMSGAWSFPTESGNTPDEDRFGKPYSERKEEIEAQKREKERERKERLANLKKRSTKSSKAKAMKAPTEEEEAEGEEEDEEEVEETEE